MGLLNSLDCFLQYGNTGFSDCDIEPSPFEKVVLIPHLDTFTEAQTLDATAFITALQSKLTADSKDSRAYVLGDIEEQNPAGEAPVTETFKSGRKREVRKGTIGWELIMTGGKQKHREHAKFHGKHAQFDALLFDRGDDGDILSVVWGRATGVVATPIGGYYLSAINVSNYQSADGSMGGRWTVYIELTKASQYNEDFAYMRLSDDPFAEGTGFIPVLLAGTSSADTNLHITAKTGYGADVFALYATELADTTNWEVRNATTKAGITITSVTASATGWTFVIVDSPTDTDNPGTGGKVLVRMKAPSVLAGNDVTGIESNEITVTLG